MEKQLTANEILKSIQFDLKHHRRLSEESLKYINDFKPTEPATEKEHVKLNSVDKWEFVSLDEIELEELKTDGLHDCFTFKVKGTNHTQYLDKWDLITNQRLREEFESVLLPVRIISLSPVSQTKGLDITDEKIEKLAEIEYPFNGTFALSNPDRSHIEYTQIKKSRAAYIKGIKKALSLLSQSKQETETNK